jgi:thiamine transporter ThiT
MLSNVKSNFNPKVWVFIVSALVIDLLLAQISTAFPVSFVHPIVGLFFISVLCGPWAGALTGLLGQIIIDAFFFLVFPESRDYLMSLPLSWWLLPAFMGYFAGKLSQWGYFKSWWLSILAGFLTAVATTAVYFAMNRLFFPNNPNLDSLDLIFGFVSGSNLSEFPVLPITSSALLTFFLLKSPLNRFFIALPQFENIVASQKRSSSTTQKIVGGVVLAIVIPWVIFVVLFALASLH